MNVKYGTFHLDATAGSGAAAPAADPAPAAPAAGGAPAPSPAPADGAPSGATAQPGSLLARGAGPAPAGSAPAPAPAGDGARPAAIPEKYIVKREDGTTDHEATALKVAEGYSHLERRLGTGDAPPKTPDEYAPELPQGLSADTLKGDPLYAGFLKGAHAKGMTNAQVSYVLNEFAARQAMAASPEAAEAELRKEWQTDEQLSQGLQLAHRAAQAFGGKEFQRLDAKFGSDPDFIKLMSKIGRELGEDTQPNEAQSEVESLQLESLMKSEAYFNAKHPDHATTVAKVRAAYAKRYKS